MKMPGMKHLYRLVALVLLSVSFTQSRGQAIYENIVQINGVIMTADSLRSVPGATVLVKNKNRGVETNGQGVFSIVLYKGDTLEFTALGYRGKEFVVPTTIKGNFYSMIQLMTQDTFYLPETVIRALPDREHFDEAFRSWHIEDDQYEIARRNTDEMTLRTLATTLQKDGGEFQSSYQRLQANAAVYYGQVQPTNILNPLAWGEFYEAWKRGDYRRRK